jgi:hypothetical protein
MCLAGDKRGFANAGIAKKNDFGIGNTVSVSGYQHQEEIECTRFCHFCTFRIFFKGERSAITW